MNDTSPFFISHEDDKAEEHESSTYTTPIFNIPDTPLDRPPIPSKFIKKWSEYTDETAIQKSVSVVNGDMSFSLPIVKVNLNPLLKIEIELIYMSNKDGIECEIPLTKHFISIDHQKSVFKNDAIYYINSMGTKMTLEGVGPNEFKLLDDPKGDVDVMYYPNEEYFVVESDIEKLVYGNVGGTGSTLYELSYRHWRETGSDPENLLKIPVAWFLAEKHSKIHGKSIFYRYETVDVTHELNRQVSYTSEVMLKSIDDGSDVKVEFEYGLKETSENEELKLKTDEGNLRMGNFLVEKHFLKRIKVETENYEQDFGLIYDLFDGKKRVLKALTQVMSDGKSEEVLSMKNQKIFDKVLPSEIGMFHGVTTKFTYDKQVIPPPQLEKKFLLKNRPVISYGPGIISFAAIIDKDVLIKVFNTKTFKMVKKFLYSDKNKNAIDTESLQVSFSQNFLVVTYTTEANRSLVIYHQNGREKWHDTPFEDSYSKDSRVHTTGRDYIVIQDGLKLIVFQKKWNLEQWDKYEIVFSDKNMKVFIKGKSIFVREKSLLRVVYKTDNGEWKDNILKKDIESSVDRIIDLFDINDETQKKAREPLEQNEVKVMNNVVIISNLIFQPNNGQFRTVFNFITVGDNYKVIKNEELYEDQEKISDVKLIVPNEGFNMTMKYQVSKGKYVFRVVDFDGSPQKEVNSIRNKNQREETRREYLKKMSDATKEKARGNIFLKWSQYYPVMDNGKNDMFFSEAVQFHMTGDKWSKKSIDSKREVKLGEYYKLIFDNKDPNTIKLVSQKDQSYKLDIVLKQPNMMINMYPQYIAYQPDNDITKLVVFDDGKSIVNHVTFEKENLMFESNQGYFITIKVSSDLSHSEPYEINVRNMAKYLPNKPQAAIKMTEMWKDMRNWPQPVIDSSSSITRVNNYERSFKVNQKLWTAFVKTMNGYSADENGWVEYVINRNDEAEIEQITNYYDSNKNLLKSEVKEEDPKSDKDYSDNLLYDISGTLQISNIIPYKKSDGAFGYLGFEDYEETDGWTFSSQNVVKRGFALTGKNYLRLSTDDKFEKSFIPKNKNEIFTVAAWMRSNILKLNDSTENFKAVISYSKDGRSFTELYGILGKLKYKTGEWSNVEVSIDIPKLVRGSYNSQKQQDPTLPEFDTVDIKITITAFGPANDSIDIDNVVFYPAPHRLTVNVYNENRDAIAGIHNDGQITRMFFDSINYKEIGRTKKNGKLEQFLIRNEGEKDSPKVITKFSLSSGFYEDFDKIMFTNRWKMNVEQNWSILPTELLYDSKISDGVIKVRDEKMMDEKSAALRLEVSLDSTETSKFEFKFTSDSIKLISNGSNQAELNVNNRRISNIPQHCELTVFKYQKRTVIWVDGVIKLDEELTDTWKGFSLNFLGKVAVRNIFVLNSPKVEVFYHNSFDEKQQVIKLVSENSAIITQYVYDRFGREIVNTKPTKVTKSSSEPLLKFHGNFIKSFDSKTGQIEGDVVTENPGDEGFPYSQTIFFKSPLNEKQKVGQPGKDYSLHSSFSTTYSKDFKIPFLNAYFPDSQGFTKHAEDLSNGSKRVIVLDKHGYKVAKYVRVPNFDDLFMTFEHDSEGRVVKVLSPQYHEAAKTFLRIGETYKVGEAGLSDGDKKLQEQLGSHFKYNEHGNVIEKRTPDVGRQVMLYNSMNLLKFTITFNADPNDGQTIYCNYDSSGSLIETGHIARPVSVEYLEKFLESNFHTEATEFQKIQLNDGKSKTIETINHDTTVIEEINYDENEEDKIVSRKVTVPTLTDSLQVTFDLQRKYKGDNVEVLTYPTTDEGKTLKVKNTYNAAGQLIGIGTVEKPFCFAKFSYGANGQPASEIHELNNLNRKYSYNSPGYMNNIDDEFMSEDISYIDGGYGQRGYGDGIVMKTAYNAKWSDKFFEKLNKKENESGDKDYEDYKDGVVEEENLRSENQNGDNLRPVNLNSEPMNNERDNSLRNKIVPEQLSSSDSKSAEDSVENRSKRAAIVESSIENGIKSAKPMKNRVRSIRQKVSVKNIIRKRSSSSKDQITSKQRKESTVKTKRDTQTSRQSKIDKVLADPKRDACISSLKSSKFISDEGLRFSKLLNTNAELNLPLKCFDDHIYDEISAKRQIPKHYGHRFTYGTHRELVKSKYFSTKDEEEAEPLQMSTFHDKMPEIGIYASHKIFNILKAGHFISVDQRRSDKKSSIGTRGTSSLLRDDDIVSLLNELGQNENYDFLELLSVVQQLILYTIENKVIMEYTEFEKIFLSWKSAATNTVIVQLEMFKRYARNLFDGLVQHQLLPSSQDTLITPINKKLVLGLKSYKNSQIIDIVGVVSKTFTYELLSTAFDTASYEIDPNGNHKKFATGFESVKLDYHENTSKLKTLNIKGQTYTVDHDGYGNMTSAPHKGVKKIIYHPVSRRVMEVLLTSGGSIKFHYNSQGERILKQVYNNKYEITKEILYIRDEDGNVLMDRVMNFNQQDKTCYEVVTHYIYGPRGMIGFIRNDKFHSIFTDHSGSVRLVIRDGEVVASYDFLPYGETMRKFVADDSADIRYLYHGKELDEESSTYNFHARFYDPTIGRFLQTDPQSQYFSPYKFSGNSPVSFIDPDGEFAFLFGLIFGIVGGYLSAASHNKSWDPSKWDFTDPGTYLSFFSGALSGAFLPGGFLKTIGTLHYILTPTLMAINAYISAAAANGSWNPLEWNFNDPGTISAIFSGLSAGVSTVKGGFSVVEFKDTLTRTKQIAFFATATFIGLAAFSQSGLALNEGNTKFWQWDPKNPALYKSLLDGFSLGMTMPLVSIQLGKDVAKFLKQPKVLLQFFKNLRPKNFHHIKAIFANKDHPLYKFLGSVGVGYIMGSAANNDFNPLNWNQNFGTYAAVMNGMLLGKKFTEGIATTTKADIKAVFSKEWNDIKSVGTAVKGQCLKLQANVAKLNIKRDQTYSRVDRGSRHSNSDIQDSIRQRAQQLAAEAQREVFKHGKFVVYGTREDYDRYAPGLSACGARRRRTAGGICQMFRTGWTNVKDVFTVKDFNSAFEYKPILSNLPTAFNMNKGFIKIAEPADNNSNDNGRIVFERKRTPDSEPGRVLYNKTVIDIDLSDRQKRDDNKVSIIMTDQVPGAAIFTREKAGKLEIFHQYTEPETKIALTEGNGTIAEFYDTVEGIRIRELEKVKILRLFDRQNNELKMRRGVFEIPDDGIVKFITNGMFEVLRSINTKPIREIANKNRQIRIKNADTLRKKLPNFTEGCDTCKVIRWEDHLPAGVIDRAYSLNIDRQLKATVVIYKDKGDNWKLASQLVQFNKEKAGAPEIAEIRPKAKIFDIKLSEKKVEKNNSPRKPRNVEFVPEDVNIPARNFNFIDNPSPNFNHSTPSVLDLGDFWLNATDFNSNLTLAYAFLKKWTNETLFSTNEGNMPKITEIEFEIFANDLLYEFTENVIESADKVGMPSAVRHIFEELNFQQISKEVKRKCEKNLTEEIPKFLMKEILEKNEQEIVEKSSTKKFEKLRQLMSDYLVNFADDLTARNDKLWNGE